MAAKVSDTPLRNYGESQISSCLMKYDATL